MPGFFLPWLFRYFFETDVFVVSLYSLLFPTAVLQSKYTLSHRLRWSILILFVNKLYFYALENLFNLPLRVIRVGDVAYPNICKT